MEVGLKIFLWVEEGLECLNSTDFVAVCGCDKPCIFLLSRKFLQPLMIFNYSLKTRVLFTLPFSVMPKEHVRGILFSLSSMIFEMSVAPMSLLSETTTI